MLRAVVILSTAIVSLALMSLRLGDLPLSFAEVLGALFQRSEGNEAVSLVVNMVRLPRILLGVLVGASLAVAGALAQTIMRNPLAEPGLIGINGGAACGAMIVLTLLPAAGMGVMGMAAFAGGLAMAVAIYVLAWRGGANPLRIILVGIGLSAVSTTLISFVAVFSDVATVQRAQVWLSGSIYQASWEQIRALGLWLSLLGPLILMASHQLDTIAFDDETARGVGQNVERTRLLLMLACVLVSAAAVCVSGLIAFVGLVAPHIARRLVGHAHIRLLPTAALVGAALLLAADLAGRTLIAPAQLPAGLVAALIGAPAFGWLFWRNRNAEG
ncbi:iron ABC transporter permease [Aureimonas altamirensis]|uniref:FecCD family ABC transporter permease n=1 Tax=Aureimonas altamirensis TaxID=370622 RepID=UPI001E55D5C8|nr:iron ABC transporter permease [Aureimonas altamirensis]UHD46328.1 iron ABC transporter permease [Aureimonas altamirensis]